MAESGASPRATIGGGRDLGPPLEPLFAQLKPGPGMSAEQVLSDQRERLHGSTIALVDQIGWSNVRVRALVRTAGVSTATFYRHFPNADACLASTYDSVIGNMLLRSKLAQSPRSDWRRSLRASVSTLLDRLAREPRAAHLVLVDAFGGGPLVRQRMGQAIGELEEILARSFAGAPLSIRPPRHLVAGMTAGMLRVARTTTLTGRAAELPEVVDEIVDWMETLPDPEVLSLVLGPRGTPADRTREAHPFPGCDPHGSSSIAGDDRERLLRAAIKLATADGPRKLTIPRMRAEADVSRRRFDQIFGNLDECLLEAVGLLASDAAERARSWSELGDVWEHRTCRFVMAICAQIARNRPQARLAFLGAFVAGDTGLQHRELLIGRTATALRETVTPDKEPAAVVSEASIAAIWQVVQADIAAGRVQTLPSIAPLLSYIVLAPIIGAETAAAAVAAAIGTNRGSGSDV